MSKTRAGVGGTLDTIERRNDEEIVRQVRKKVQELNAVLTKAHKAGMRVDVAVNSPQRLTSLRLVVATGIYRRVDTGVEV